MYFILFRMTALRYIFTGHGSFPITPPTVIMARWRLRVTADFDGFVIVSFAHDTLMLRSDAFDSHETCEKKGTRQRMRLMFRKKRRMNGQVASTSRFDRKKSG